MARDAVFLVEVTLHFALLIRKCLLFGLQNPARWCAVLGVVLSLFFLLRGKRLAPKLKTYQGLSWLNLAALLGIIASLPFAPPWDGETRIFAATLPLFFLLPASGVGGLYLLIVNRFHEVTLESTADPKQNIAIGSAAFIGGILSVVILSAHGVLSALALLPKIAPTRSS